MFFDLPSGAKVDKYLAGMPTTQWLTWTNPRNEYSNAIILAAGGGGGGRPGTTTTGGRGGGAGGFGHVYCPLSLLPDSLYIQVGLGGNPDTNGGTTYINIYPYIQIGNNLIQCIGGLTNLTGGVVTINNTLGVAQGYQGGNGGTGGANFGTNSLPATGTPIYGGGGGAATAVGVGGGMTSVSSLYTSVAGASGANNGADGFVIQKPFTVFGGCGAASDGVDGYNGGNGIMGSGGGGGGANPTGILGVGGKGGDGFVIIICY